MGYCRPAGHVRDAEEVGGSARPREAGNGAAALIADALMSLVSADSKLDQAMSAISNDSGAG
jgi:hypothetical protein